MPKDWEERPHVQDRVERTRSSPLIPLLRRRQRKYGQNGQKVASTKAQPPRAVKGTVTTAQAVPERTTAATLAVEKSIKKIDSHFAMERPECRDRCLHRKGNRCWSGVAGQRAKVPRPASLSSPKHNQNRAEGQGKWSQRGHPPSRPKESSS